MKEAVLAGLLFCSSSISATRPFAQLPTPIAGEDDRKWALRSGLQPEEIRKLRKLTGVEDPADGYIDNLDSHSFRSRNHIFVATAGGNGHCLDLYVFARRGGGFQKVWAVEEKGYCRESPKNPESHATSGGKIIVKIPVYNYQKQVDRGTVFYTYAWNGRTYNYVGKKIVNAARALK